MTSLLAVPLFYISCENKIELTGMNYFGEYTKPGECARNAHKDMNPNAKSVLPYFTEKRQGPGSGYR